MRTRVRTHSTTPPLHTPRCAQVCFGHGVNHPQGAVRAAVRQHRDAATHHAARRFVLGMESTTPRELYVQQSGSIETPAMGCYGKLVVLKEGMR